MNRLATRLALALIVSFAACPAFGQGAAAAPRGAGNDAAASGVPAAPPVVPRGYFSVNGMYQATTSSFASTSSVPYFLERESLTSSYSIKPGVAIDVGGGLRVWRNLAVGVAASRYHRADLASLSATVPHPLLYNQPRTFTGTAAGPSRTEIAIHANAMWIAALAPRMQLGVFGGPSFFNVKQVTVATVDFAETYPYTAVTVATMTTRARTDSKIGFNAGVDMTFLLSRRIGIGALVRYSRASLGFALPSGAYMATKAGGVQAGAGLRVRF